MDNTEMFLKPAAAAKLLSLSRSKLYQLLSSGEIVSLRVGGVLRIPKQALIEMERRALQSAKVVYALEGQAEK